ncbi:MAG: hypothetical protein ACXWLN_09400 [Thermoanaerobaculia bacterium]
MPPEIIATRRLFSAGGPFDSNRFERLGGVGLFWFELRGTEIRYDMEVFPNPHATTANRLPESVQALLHRRLPKKPLMSVGGEIDTGKPVSSEVW